ncbi:hypothetical protein [Halobacteriovorax sp. HLS]|uniref:hypothetical protein n=1 Tax=Halobacteriovorax sp. HLS TaxID=2234000 RepID=UPI000FD7CBBF|nr:hypothetical protein [Halobacteriovorax sp. HLS]
MFKQLLLVSAILLTSLNSFANSAENAQITDVSTYEPHWTKLPIFGKEAHDLGYELPIPVGLSLVYNYQSIDYKADEDLLVQLSGGVLGALFKSKLLIPKDDVKITGHDSSVQLRADAWVFPFLNLFVVGGYTEGKKNILAKMDSLSNGGWIGDAIFVGKTLPIPIEYTAVNFGGGMILAGQYELFKWTNPIVFTLMGMGTNAWTDTLDSTIQMGVAQLKLGQRYKVPGGMLTYLIGYNYQYLNQDVTGSYNFSGTDLEVLMRDVDFDVKIQSKETHNLAVSFNYDFGHKQRWSIFTEYGFLNWDQVVFQLGRRF